MTGTLVWAAVAACALAIALALALLLVPRRTRVPITRLDPTARPVPEGWAAVVAAGARTADRVLVPARRRAALVGSLERAGVHRSPAQVMSWALAGTLVLQLLGHLAAGPVGAVLLTPLAPLALFCTVRVRSARRRTAFADQLDDTLRLMASGLRAGHSVLRTLETVAHEAQSPTADEFRRVLNEVRVGRDLVEALDEVAERTASQDLSWVSQAVAIHREVGGNLAEVLDRVGATIRDRTQLRRQARALSAEGRASAAVLLALPVVLGSVMYLIAPGYLGALTDTAAGLVLLAVAGVLMAVGAVWVRSVVTVRF